MRSAKNLSPETNCIFKMAFIFVHPTFSRSHAPPFNPMKREGAKDSLREVLKMNCIESYFPDEQLPPSPALKVIHINDPDYGQTEDEIQDRYEFIRCYLLSEFESLMLIPKQDLNNDFFIADVDVYHDDYSAFNTHDFQKLRRKFRRYNYAMQKILERVKDLAIMHSCITQPENQRAVYEQFKSFMAFQFTNEVEELARQLHSDITYYERSKIKRRIQSLSRNIRKCKKVWERYAPPDFCEN